MLRRKPIAPIVAMLVGLATSAAATTASAELSGAAASGDITSVFNDGIKWMSAKTDAKSDTRTSRAEGDERAARSTTYGESTDRRPPVVLLPNARRATPVAAERPVDAPKDDSPFPRLRPSVVARDWNGSFAVFGKELPSDNIRLTRSSRMLVARVSAGEGRIKPFAHMGLGEWRYDPYLLPLMPRNQEYASQFSGGVSIELFKSTTFVWEADYTVLLRESREPQNLPTPAVLGSFAILETRL